MRNAKLFFCFVGMGTGAALYFFLFPLKQNLPENIQFSTTSNPSFFTIPAKKEELLKKTILEHSHPKSNESDDICCGNGPRFYPDIDLKNLSQELVAKKVTHYDGNEMVQEEILVYWEEGKRSPEHEKNLELVSWNETLKLARYRCLNLSETLKRFETNGILAEPNFVARTAFEPNDPRYVRVQKKHLSPLGVEEVWDIHQGLSSVVIAVIDSGVDGAHEDLEGNVLPGIDFTECPIQNRDLTGHGTAMAGLIGAHGNNNKGIAGVVWNCKILPIRVADHQGVATYEQLISGIRYAADHGAHILNISLGSLAYSKILHQAIQYAAEKGCLLVAPAGNDLSNSPVYPACFPEVMCVVSVSDTTHLSLTTNVPNESEVAAPGKKLLTTWPMNMYAEVSGTSCSAALVTGEAALLWSLAPEATAEQIRKIIVHNTTKIPLIERLSSFLNFGCIHLSKAVEALQSESPLLEVRRVASFPSSPVSGHPVQVKAHLWNRTLHPLPETVLTYEINGTQIQQSIQLEPLATQEQTISFSMPQSEALLSIYESSAEDPSFLHLLTPSLSAQPQLQWSQIRMIERNKIHFEIWVENQGTTSSASFSWQAFLNQTLFQQGTVGSLQPQERKLIRITEESQDLPTEKTQVFRIESNAIADPLYYVFTLGQKGQKIAKTLYQQGGDVDFIADMPYRLRPSGSYVPLMIFLPNNGGNSEIDYLSIDSCKITLKSSPEAEAEGVVVYEDAPDTDPLVLAEGIELINEEGEIQTVSGSPDYNLFEDEKQFFRGRSAILRIPRTLFPTEDPDSDVPLSFAEVHISWSFYRILLSGFEKVDEGLYDQTLRVLFPSTEWPVLPGSNFYYDTHVHTVAEWAFSEEVDLFAPEKAYGGPIQMIKESAYAIGLTDSLEAVKERVITTDHNCFFNDGKETGEEDSPDYRPTWGPTSPSSSLAEDGSTKSEWDRMKDIFGDTAGEEISFSQNQFSLVPMGAHMLSYQGEHFDGTWHGGSGVSEILGEGLPLKLDFVLKSLATIKEDGTNTQSFTYAAHPYSSQGWATENIDMAMGVSESAADYLKESDQFVFKGFQLYNGKGEQGLPTPDIFFDSLNPFINSAWKSGNSYWDKDLQNGLVQWQIHLARVMPYSHPTLPGVALIRKLYISGGSDAHGDFNYSTGRLAKLLDFQATFSVDSSAFGKVRSYVFTDEIEGTSPEDKGLRALSQGSSIATDGIILYFEMDSDGKWDPKKLIYHDTSSLFENAEGFMGGSGKFDGGRSMLVTKSCEETHLKYKYATTPEFGGTVEAIHIYKATATRGNRFRLRKIEGTSGLSTEFITQLTAAGTLTAGASTGEGTHKLEEDKEGTVRELSCLSLGGFSHGDPDFEELPAEASRCYTNPIWAIPVDVDVTLTKVNYKTRSVAPGDLKVTFTFPVSMSPDEILSVKVKQLDSSGKTPSGTTGVLGTLSSEGWETGTEVKNSVILYTNPTTITASETPYPAPGSYTFLVYLDKAPKDYFGNELNSICKKVKISTPGGCFLATAAMSHTRGEHLVENGVGSYQLDTPSFQKLETLRTFRDQTLTESSLGTLFIHQYYTYAPEMSEDLQNHPFYRSLVHGLLVTPCASLLNGVQTGFGFWWIGIIGCGLLLVGLGFKSK